MLRRLAIVAAFAAVAGKADANAEADERLPNRVALIPFVNVGQVDARELLMAAVPAALARRGYEVVTGPLVDDSLEADRVRYVDSIPTPALQRVLEATGTSAAIMGNYFVTQEANKPPTFGAIARLVGPGGDVLWVGSAALAPADTEGLFGLGGKKSLDALMRLASRDLFESFPGVGGKVPLRTGLAGDGGRPRAYTRGGTIQGGKVYLMPLDNFSGLRTAPRLIEMLLVARLGTRPGLHVIEPSDMRAALAAEEIHSFLTYTPAQRERLLTRLGAAYVLRGAIFTMGYERDVMGHFVPEVALNLQLIDARTGTVAWSSSHERTGSSYETVMGMGIERTLFGVADGVVSEMIATISSHE